ncbi:Cobalt-precorrin-2 C(20)-methyltransferase [Pelagimonas phthalicica]|uniref:Precorrin-6A synthase [deacetylating] n=1 Tax=Pelagimonas phthalicica TaxID=1037362 RepID=A0A238JCI7_9RHOB|nr:precorrin-6A synthase (deacetylating) [Pelagimonas phthalicica]TDS91271.1 precorrin-6A synthase (deacetylating) [Pelagimonas phthalicica]SMX28319.1 Cobalt-precorrin-2 C(20)-methyltransferase [Pelagimonas phthalicica]
MIDLLLVGIGAGNPKHLTLEAIEALNSADVILIPRKGPGKDDLAELRRVICRDYLTNGGPPQHEFDLPVRDPATPDYVQRVNDWHDAIATAWQDAITSQVGSSGRVAFLVWGDPSLYDSTLRIAERVQSKLALRLTVIPGITSVQALTAGHTIPLNTLAAPVTITTGRKLRDFGWPPETQTLVVMLDAGGAFEVLAKDDYDIWWSAFAGMPQEIRIAGPLSEVQDHILETRAKARADHGWIMDVYLIRKRDT